MSQAAQNGRHEPNHDQPSLTDHPRVDTEPARGAFVCGAAGCHQRDGVVLVVIDDWGQRAVCRRKHLPDLLAKVLGGDDDVDE